MTNTTYVRWQRAEARAQRAFLPLTVNHPAYSVPCAQCGRPLGDGTDVQLLVIGPDDQESRQQHDDGHWYAALAILLHVACVRQLEDHGAVEDFIAGIAPIEQS